MRKFKGFSPLVRAIGVFSAVAVIVGGVTFAAISSSVTLTGNTFSTANADLKIWNGSEYTDTSTGFTVNNLVPGQFSDPNFFYFRNDSGTPLDLTAEVTGNPTTTGVANKDVTLQFKSYAPGCVDNTKEYTLAELKDATPDELPCNPLASGATGNSGVQNTEGNYSVAFKVDNVNKNGATVSGLNLRFTGMVGSNNTTEEAPVTNTESPQ